MPSLRAQCHVPHFRFAWIDLSHGWMMGVPEASSPDLDGAMFVDGGTVEEYLSFAGKN